MKLNRFVQTASTAALCAALTLSTGGAVSAKTVHRAPASGPPIVMVPGQGGQFQENFNPYSGLIGTQGLIYQPLFYFNPAGQAVPLLGQSFAWSNGNHTLTVMLRKGVKWSDGKPFTSADVVFSFNLLKRFPQLDGAGIWKVISSVKAVGAYEVQFTFPTPNVPYEYYMLGTTYIVPQHIWASVKDPTKSINPHPVGTGPFVLTSFSPEMYTFGPNSSYWGGKPRVSQVQVPAYSSGQSATLALLEKKIDWTGLFIPHIDRVYVSRDAQNNHYWFSSYGGANMIYTNLTDPLLSQLPVRKAISLGIDRQKVSQLGEYGYEPPANPAGYSLPPAGQVWMNPKLPKSFVYNPTEAVQILEKAGFKKNSQGIFVSPKGQPLSFTLDVVSGWTDWDADCALIAQQLKQIGIQVSVQQLAFGAYYQDLSTGHFQMAMSWSGSGPTPYYMYQPLFQPGGPANWDHWNNPYTTRLLAMYEHSSNPAVQRQAVYGLESAMAYSLPYIPLVYGVGWNEYSTKSYVGWPSASNPYAAGSPWIAPSNGLILARLQPRG